ncbi:DUF4142 domain-containing protein [Pedobacter gandavensis]|uniref:DUF4142 domain-containing protein n=1 Tax=Pedobacter gandavensis TaxID=2679963 RepID=A0ABR6EQF2_9SPHI|nr:DUF4142 domain-containing protein [Pedobacter gandavensis]MBB2147461.1 DUF4142 domain-containing protein [Pedobacter gandavensis]
MKSISIFKYGIHLLVLTILAACMNTDKSGKVQDLPLKKSHDLTDMSKVDGDGANFMDTAAVAGMMEVDLARLALEKSTNAKVKKFASQMIADYTKTNQELKAIALKLEHLLPTDYPADVMDHMNEMKNLNQKEFDIHYMDMMVYDHEKTIDLFKTSSSLKQEVKDFIKQTLPILEKHYQMAKEIQTSLK